VCNYCDPKGWEKKVCNYCGAGSTVYISISISVPHGGDFPYSTTDLCERCYKTHGAGTAFGHNSQCREDLIPE